MSKIKLKLKQLSSKPKGKPAYIYLAVVLPKVIMEGFNPTHITFNSLITLHVRKHKNGKGYAVFPREIVKLFNLTKNQEVEIKLKVDEK